MILYNGPLPLVTKCAKNCSMAIKSYVFAHWINIGSFCTIPKKKYFSEYELCGIFLADIGTEIFSFWKYRPNVVGRFDDFWFILAKKISKHIPRELESLFQYFWNDIVEIRLRRRSQWHSGGRPSPNRWPKRKVTVPKSITSKLLDLSSSIRRK